MAFERVVLDASVTLDWFLPTTSDAAAYAAGVLSAIQGRAMLPLVPDLWHYEVGSVLIAAKRQKRISARRLDAAAAVLADLVPFTINTRLSGSDVIQRAVQFHLQGYDAVYFDLARNLHVRIASSDGGVHAACRSHGVTIWEK